jgi:hypothetical protein
LSDETLVDKWVQQYIALRDELKRRDELHETATKELKDLMADRAGKLQAFLDKSGVESASTQYGTVYTTTRYSASVADPKAFMEYVIQNQDWDMIERRANVTAARDFVKDHNAPVPGVNLSSLATIGVRRPSAKSKA